ncbi:GNAT family N-acetyltransferase [Vibrio agarivorans]|uniref:GNAT family N-acetyltransferase n=1 Tax=Vibrio agarivorans TaxID=153622 RepID=A0ABT7Y4E3_9VIBR|nr:GNAT family N-acetyltransferase [Vibrio agarivorans]MDN2482921.1 GNAT family N-acetyltransferase [Vibrio agarivorans]
MKNQHFNQQALTFRVAPHSELPEQLLLEADPSLEAITKYLTPEAQCFICELNQQIVGAVVLAENIQGHLEIYNVSVAPHLQGNGIGSELIKFTLNSLKLDAVESVVLGTGTFGYQLAFYQKLGFRIESIDKDYFLRNYSDEIWEDGIQHKDMLRLCIDLSAIAPFDIG